MTGSLRPVTLGPRDVVTEHRADGAILIRSVDTLNAYPRVITERLAEGARQVPDRVFLGQRTADGTWRTVTYAQALAQVESLGQALLDRGLSADRPVLILSENDIDHALLSLAGQHVGVPTAAISTAYSLISEDFGKLRHVFDILTPGMVFAANGQRYARAFKALDLTGAEVVVTDTPAAGHPATLLADLLAVAPTDAVAAAHARIQPDDVAKFLFTSGSTGVPKGVINTHRMICSNQQMILQMLGLVADEPPVLLDWLPWSHTFGGNHNLGIALYNLGSFYIDEGRPLPGAVERTVANLRDIAPTIYFNVPKGYEELLPRLRADDALRTHFFSRLRMLFYAGAGLSPMIWNAYRDLATQTCGARIYMTTSLGSTETAPFSLGAPWEAGGPGEIGIPAAGLDVKMVPAETKLELRVRGPNITPGYWRQPTLSKAAFDEEGFYKMGDALRFADPADPSRGFLFDGRIAEDFKLASGTWVSVGPLRARIVGHFAPFVRDCAITGHDRDDVGALLVPDLEMCRSLCVDLPGDAPVADVLCHHSVQAEFRGLLDSFAAHSTGSASRVVRALLLEDPPSLDTGEMTDKGSLNQRAILTRRAALVDDLYADAPPPHVITLSGVPAE
ncbi:MAG: feruloyl-CoA synthase [Rhodospirillaceae bacterium BRH_c57]|nr:MAG: feruloyl-CoA synthase [Rhodospirillaceae bacterium BRH_c57]